MAVIQAHRVEATEGEFDRRQIVKVPKGLYGGMFARYTMPKSYPKYQSEEEELKFFAWFVLTHDRGNNRLPHFSEAMVSIRPKLFFDAKTDRKSSYVGFLYALLGGKQPYEEIVAKGEFDLDTFIGRPAILFVEPNKKVDKNGNLGHRVTGIEPADAALVEAIRPLYRERKIEEVGEKALKRLVYPSVAYEEDIVANGSSNGSTASSSTEHDDDLFEDTPYNP